jgi:diguanylate cyclase (GGDEF)-like protein/putative nucleotidyltransferase with HDIG domain
LGDCSWAYQNYVLHHQGAPGHVTDILYMAGYGVMVCGMAMMARFGQRGDAARLGLDCLMVAAGVGMAGWHFLIRPLWYASYASFMDKSYGVMQPVGDVILIVGVYALCTSVYDRPSFRTSARLLALAMFVAVLADCAYSVSLLRGGYDTGPWVDLCWISASLICAYAAMRAWWAESLEDAEAPHRGHGRHHIGLTQKPWPIHTYAPIALVLFVLASHHVGGTGVDGVEIALSAVLIMAAIARQVMVVIDTTELNRHLRGATDDLERTVATRTRQLRVLHGLARAVNRTLRVEEVIHASARHSRRALRADAAFVMLDGPDEGPAGTEMVPIAMEGELPPCGGECLRGPWSTREFVGRDSVQACPRLHRDCAATLLRMPLRWSKRVVGTITVARWNGDFDASERRLLAAIARTVGTALGNARLHEDALKAADYDAVTGLPNHRLTHQLLEKELGLAAEQGSTLSIITMDVDNFRLFNNAHGYAAGDQLLRSVAAVLKEQSTPAETWGRYGGDEFLVILPGVGEAGALSVARRFRVLFETEDVRWSDDCLPVPLRLSFGIATYPADGATRHELLDAAEENLQLAKRLEQGVQASTDDMRARQQLISEGNFGVLDALVAAVDNKDRYTRNHSEDVAKYALWMVEELGLSEEFGRIARLGALLHDLGKICIPGEILRKPGRLSADEYEIIMRHPLFGVSIAAAVPGSEDILDAVRSHHERWDGTGYPDNLSGEEIPLLGRVIALADAVSAMTTDRPYRKSLSWEEAMEQVRAGAGSQFDPLLVGAFLAAAERHAPSRRAA